MCILMISIFIKAQDFNSLLDSSSPKERSPRLEFLIPMNFITIIAILLL